MNAASSVSMFSAGSFSRSFPLRRWGVPAIFLVAVAARLYGLTYHSLWFDEVMSTFWAARPAAEIWRVGVSLIQDKHPPLYYLALHAWTVLFGSGDVAVRTLGVIIGALAVLPAYGIGKTLGNARAGMLGALLLALNPFLIWYSQEARMFMPATTLGLIGLYGVLQIANSEWRMLAPVLLSNANAGASVGAANPNQLLSAIRS